MRLALLLVAFATFPGTRAIGPAVAIAATRTVTFPLVIDHPILEAALRRDLGMTDGASLELWGSPGECHWAVADDLALVSQGGLLRATFTGSTVVGFRLLWFCVSPLAWQGSLTLITRPVVGRDWQLRFEMVDVEAKDRDGKPSLFSNGALQIVKGQLEERLGAFHFDLTPPAEEANQLIRATARSDDAKAALAALETLRPLETVAEPDGIRVRIAIDVPEREASPHVPEGRLTEAQVRAWEDRIDSWDAFLVFVVKTLGVTTTDRGVRNELLAILLDGRRELVDVLRQGPVPGTDPVRNLFLSAWDRLRVQTRRALREGTLGESAFRYVTFLAAGDALAALDQAGPGLGLEISADGLRRLARLLDPESRGDPIASSDALDAELRSLFDFEDYASEKVPSPVSSTTAAPTTTAVPVTTDVPATTTDVPTATEAPGTTVPSTTLPLSWLWSPRAADAATPPPVDLAAIGNRLDRWVPSPDELRTYRDHVEQLLTTLAAHRMDRVDPPFRPVYRNLVPAVAWQESCWRQFVARNGKVTYLLSPTGDVGIMQVNRRVWRGFFEVQKLEWDVVYNAAAGAEILVQLLGRVAVKEGNPHRDNAARATYAAYNAGPGAYARYRSPKASKLGKAIDADFYEKYRRVADGAAGDLVLCM
jgi:hypothetical protein